MISAMVGVKGGLTSSVQELWILPSVFLPFSLLSNHRGQKWERAFMKETNALGFGLNTYHWHTYSISRN